MFFFNYFIHYDWFTREEEYGLATEVHKLTPEDINMTQESYERVIHTKEYLASPKFISDLSDFTKKERKIFDSLTTVYELSRFPICVGVNKITLIYRYQTERGLQCEQKVCINPSNGKNYFTMVDIVMGIEIFVDAWKGIANVDSYSPEYGDDNDIRVRNIEILSYENDMLSLLVDIHFILDRRV